MRAPKHAPPGINPSSAGGFLRNGIAADFSTMAGWTEGRAMGTGPAKALEAVTKDSMMPACRCRVSNWKMHLQKQLLWSDTSGEAAHGNRDHKCELVSSAPLVSMEAWARRTEICKLDHRSA